MYRQTWNSTVSYDERFMEMVVFAKRMLELCIEVHKAKIAGESVVEEAYRRSADKRLILLEGFEPWEDALAEHPEPLYVVKPKRENGFWEVACVRDNPYGFENRKDLPADWHGLFDGDLAKVTGVPESVFCHNKGYIAVTTNKEGALRLAQLALDA
jgi:uncharacterized UPF0160 family protein